MNGDRKRLLDAEVKAKGVALDLHRRYSNTKCEETHRRYLDAWEWRNAFRYRRLRLAYGSKGVTIAPWNPLSGLND